MHSFWEAPRWEPEAHTVITRDAKEGDSFPRFTRSSVPKDKTGSRDQKDNKKDILYWSLHLEEIKPMMMGLPITGVSS